MICLIGEACPGGCDACVEGADECLVYYDTPATYAEASDTCRSQGGNLVSIFDESYQHIVEALIAAHNDTTIWTGGRLFSRDLSQQWAWLSSKTKE